MVDKLNVPTSTPDPKIQETHEEKMVKVAEENQGDLRQKTKDGEETVVTPQGQAAPTVTPRPDDIPEKFWDAEKGEVNVAALLKSQQDAEAALQGKKPTEEKPAEEEKPKVPEGTTDEQTPVVAKASEEYAEKGELSDATYESLEKVGLSREMVAQYISGQQALVSQIETAAGEPFGGLEGFNKAADWAAEALNEDEIKALDIQLTSSNPAIVKQGAAALQEKYAANADISPEVTLSGNGSPNTGTAFRSSAEMQAAIADPRYAKDSAYRDEVAGKIARSDAALFG